MGLILEGEGREASPLPRHRCLLLVKDGLELLRFRHSLLYPSAEIALEEGRPVQQSLCGWENVYACGLGLQHEIDVGRQDGIVARGSCDVVLDVILEFLQEGQLSDRLSGFGAGLAPQPGTASPMACQISMTISCGMRRSTASISSVDCPGFRMGSPPSSTG